MQLALLLQEMFVIEGVRGNSYLGDIAIDDVYLKTTCSTPCKIRRNFKLEASVPRNLVPRFFTRRSPTRWRK